MIKTPEITHRSSGAGIEGLRCYQCVHTVLGRDVVGEGCRRPEKDDRLIATCPAHLNHCSVRAWGLRDWSLKGHNMQHSGHMGQNSCS